MTTLTIPVSQLRRGDRIAGYRDMRVERAYERPHTFFSNKEVAVIEFGNGTKVYPKSMDELVTVEREKGGDA